MEEISSFGNCLFLWNDSKIESGIYLLHLKKKKCEFKDYFYDIIIISQVISKQKIIENITFSIFT